MLSHALNFLKLTGGTQNGQSFEELKNHEILNFRPCNKMLVIETTSSGFDGRNFAVIYLNGAPVRMNRNEHDNYRGIHVCVINPNSL